MSIFDPSLSSTVDDRSVPHKNSLTYCTESAPSRRRSPAPKRKLSSCSGDSVTLRVPKDLMLKISDAKRRRKMLGGAGPVPTPTPSSTVSQLSSLGSTSKVPANVLANRFREIRMRYRANEIGLSKLVSQPPEPLTSIDIVQRQTPASTLSHPARTKVIRAIQAKKADEDVDMHGLTRKQRESDRKELGAEMWRQNKNDISLNRLTAKQGPKSISTEEFDSKQPARNNEEQALVDFVRALRLTRGNLVHHRFVCDPEWTPGTAPVDGLARYTGKTCSYGNCIRRKWVKTMCTRHHSAYKWLCLKATRIWPTLRLQ